MNNMTPKKIFVVFFVFLMILSFLVAINPNKATIVSEPIPSKVQQNSCPVMVVNNKATIPIDYDAVKHIYIAYQYNYNLNNDSQTITDYNSGTSYTNGIISNIKLVNNTAVVVIAHNSKTNAIDIIDNFCVNQGSASFGVSPGDWMMYSFTLNNSNIIPFFGYNNGVPTVQNNDKINVSINSILIGLNQPTQIILNMMVINSTTSIFFQSNETSFFVQPLDFLNSLINNTFVVPTNNTGPIPTLDTYDSSSVTIDFKSINPNFNATVVFDRMHGSLIKMTGVFLDPQNNALEMTLYLIGSHFAQQSNQNSNNTQTHVYGVLAGDEFVYTFSTNTTGKIPFFGIDNNQAIIQNGDVVKIDIVKILIGLNKVGGATNQNGTNVLAQITIGSNPSIDLNDTMFLIVPLDLIEQLIQGNYTPDINGPKVQYLGSNSANVTFRMSQVDNKTNNIQMNFTIVLDRNIGNLISMEGFTLDPQGQVIKMGLHLTSSKISQSTNKSSPSYSTSSQSLQVISTSVPGFELTALVPLIAVITIIQKRKNN